MSIEDLLSHDTCEILTGTPTIGEVMGVSETYTASDPVNCLVQQWNGAEAMEYRRRGLTDTREFMFGSDVLLDSTKAIRYRGRVYRVVNYAKDDNPDDTLELWYAQGHYDPNRFPEDQQT